MNQKEIHAKAVDNAGKRVKDVDKNTLSAIADYDRGLIEGYEDGYHQAVNDVLKAIVLGYIDSRNELLRDKVCAVDTSILEDSSSFIRAKIDKDLVIIKQD